MGGDIVVKRKFRKLKDFIFWYVHIPNPDGTNGFGNRLEQLKDAADQCVVHKIDHELVHGDGGSEHWVDVFQEFIDAGRKAEAEGLKTFIVVPEEYEDLYQRVEDEDAALLSAFWGLVMVFLGKSEADAVARLAKRLDVSHQLLS